MDNQPQETNQTDTPSQPQEGQRERRPYNNEGDNNQNQEGQRERRPYNNEGRENRPFNKKSKFAFKRKKCRFCGKDKAVVDKDLNYKNVEGLQKFISDRGKILPSRLTGSCAIHQRKLKVEIKKARYIALLPFTKVEKIKK